jgi:hypothetical protein
MAGWVDKQVDRWIDRRIDRYVDKKLDGFLADKMPEDDFNALKTMTKKGEPLDANTEQRLKEQLGDAFGPYKSVHNGVAKMERFDQSLKKITRILP